VRSTLVALIVVWAAVHTASAQNVRERIRQAPRGTAVSEAQAEALTLTIGAVAPRLVQTWVRVAGAIDGSNRVLSADLSEWEAPLVKVGQRARAFPPSAKSSMYQAFVTRVTPRGEGATVTLTLSSAGRLNSPLYVVEIVVERGPLLSVPNEAIIEEGDAHVVYVQQQPGQFTPREIRTGIQGELYTEVLDGVTDGEQVVTFGSFFIDAEQKLKGASGSVALPSP
jgi:hypothetical protein